MTNLWFGVLEDGKLKLSDNFKNSFLSAHNKDPLGFNLVDIGRNVIERYWEVLRKVAIEVGEELVKKELESDDRYVVALVKALEGVEESWNLIKEKSEDLKIRETELQSDFKKTLKELEKLRERIEAEIEETMKRIAPNLTEVAGAKIAAKLIEKFGSLERLAKASSNKIQIAGAEKSLYKALSRIRKGKEAKIPKHGIIFLHSFVHSLPKRKRGKMARFLASKIALGARIDFFKGELDESLAESVRKRFEELRRS